MNGELMIGFSITTCWAAFWIVIVPAVCCFSVQTLGKGRFPRVRIPRKLTRGLDESPAPPLPGTTPVAATRHAGVIGGRSVLLGGREHVPRALRHRLNSAIL